MNTKIKYLLLILMVPLLVSQAVSQKVAKTSMQFLKIIPCARANALGDAYSAWASGVEAVFWNPGGLALTNNHEFSATFIDWLFDAKQGAFAYAINVSDIGAFGFQIQYVDYGVFEEAVLTRPFIKELPEPGLTGRTFNPFSYVVGLSFARNLTDKFSTGLTIKYAYESLYDQKTFSVLDISKGIDQQVNTYGKVLLFDFGMRYHTGFRSVEVGAAVQNFGGQVKYAIEKNLVPLLFRVGIAGDLIGPNSLFTQSEDSRLGIAFDLFHPNDYDQQAHIGMEYEFANTVSLRMGYKYNYDNENLTFGAGIKHAINKINYSVDYSYGSLGKYLGNTHRISLGVGLQ